MVKTEILGKWGAFSRKKEAIRHEINLLMTQTLKYVKASTIFKCLETMLTSAGGYLSIRS